MVIVGEAPQEHSVDVGMREIQRYDVIIAVCSGFYVLQLDIQFSDPQRLTRRRRNVQTFLEKKSSVIN